MITIFKKAKFFSELSPENVLKILVNSTQPMSSYFKSILGFSPIDITFSKIEGHNFTLKKFVRRRFHIKSFPHEIIFKCQVKPENQGSKVTVKYNFLFNALILLVCLLLLLFSSYNSLFILLGVFLAITFGYLLKYRIDDANNTKQFLKQILEATEFK